MRGNLLRLTSSAPTAVISAIDDQLSEAAVALSAAEAEVFDETFEEYEVPQEVENAAPVRRRAEPIRFEDVVERYHGKVFQLIYRYTGNHDESADLTQDTFVRAYGAWQDFRGEAQVYTWLYRIAINLCHNQQKKLQRRHRVEMPSLESIMPDSEEGWRPQEVADERPLPLQILETSELRIRLQQALLELPDNYRTVVVLRDIEGLSYEEIARITDSSLEAIKSRLFRARGALRTLLTPYMQHPTATPAAK